MVWTNATKETRGDLDQEVYQSSPNLSCTNSSCFSDLPRSSVLVGALSQFCMEPYIVGFTPWQTPLKVDRQSRSSQFPLSKVYDIQLVLWLWFS